MSEMELLEGMVTNTGESVMDISGEKPVLLMFLRHFGCVFCKEALDNLSKRIKRIRQSQVELIFVHMATPDTAERYFGRFGIKDPLHISDPECRLYGAFGLHKGSVSQLFGLKNWIRGFSIQMNNGFPMEYDKALGDAWQMPGTFIVFKGRVEERFIHSLASDRPDYDNMINKCRLLLDIQQPFSEEPS